MVPHPSADTRVDEKEDLCSHSNVYISTHVSDDTCVPASSLPANTHSPAGEYDTRTTSRASSSQVAQKLILLPSATGYVLCSEASSRDCGRGSGIAGVRIPPGPLRHFFDLKEPEALHKSAILRLPLQSCLKIIHNRGIISHSDLPGRPSGSIRARLSSNLPRRQKIQLELGVLTKRSNL